MIATSCSVSTVPDGTPITDQPSRLPFASDKPGTGGTMPTGWLSHELYFWYDTRSAAAFMPADGRVLEPDTHSENPATKRRFRNLVDVSGLLAQLVQLVPRPATEQEILRCHEREYLERIKALSADNGGDAGDLPPFGPGGYETALPAPGGVLAATDAVPAGKGAN